MEEKSEGRKTVKNERTGEEDLRGQPPAIQYTTEKEAKKGKSPEAKERCDLFRSWVVGPQKV